MNCVDFFSSAIPTNYFAFSVFVPSCCSHAAGKSRFGSLLGNSPRKTDRLYMKGPGGRGEVEVAVSGVPGEESSLYIVI